jgi:hypothetical protein
MVSRQLYQEGLFQSQVLMTDVLACLDSGLVNAQSIFPGDSLAVRYEYKTIWWSVNAKKKKKKPTLGYSRLKPTQIGQATEGIWGTFWGSIKVCGMTRGLTLADWIRFRDKLIKKILMTTGGPKPSGL